MKNKMRQNIKQIMRYLPDQGKFIKSALFRVRMQKELLAGIVCRCAGFRRLANSYQVYWINPNRIEYHTNKENNSLDWEDWVFDQSRSIARVQGGDWDRPSHKVADMRIVRAIEERIKHGISWEKTDFFKDALRKIGYGRFIWGCIDRASFTDRCADIDRLIHSISSSGYLNPETGFGQKQATMSQGGFPEILVNLGRDGTCLFQNGRHRLAIARSLNIERIPVQVFVRHSGWQIFREFMWRMALGNGSASKKGMLYQRPIHFDLEEIPFAHECEDRWAAIRDNLSHSNGQIALDIGCNLGFFCHRLSAHGYSCIGLEDIPEVAFAARKIATAEGRQMTFILGDALAQETLHKIGRTEFAVVIALNIFHHFLKTEEQFNRLRDFMKRIAVDSMFLEPHLQSESQMEGAFFNPSPAEFAKLIQRWGSFQHAIPIHTASDGRILYKLTR